jgi:hypothetical protein
MRICKHIAALLALLAGLVLSPVWIAANDLPKAQDVIPSGNPAPSAEQIKSLIDRMIANQHKDDRAINEFERVEHVIARKSGDGSDIASDQTERILPSGTGVMKLQVEQIGVPFSQDLYRQQLQYAVSALGLYLNPNDRMRQSVAKFEKRQRDRADLVDAASKAFRVSWAGRETRGSRTLVKLLLDPDPNYKSSLRFATTFEHIRAVLWVDESEAQMVRIEGDIASDIVFVGGIAGKVYRGGHFVMEQSEVAPGVWLPTLYTYDVDGRKFLFGFSIHERTEASRYRRVGPPAQEIEMIHAELNNLSAKRAAP